MSREINNSYIFRPAVNVGQLITDIFFQCFRISWDECWSISGRYLNIVEFATNVLPASSRISVFEFRAVNVGQVITVVYRGMFSLRALIWSFRTYFCSVALHFLLLLSGGLLSLLQL